MALKGENITLNCKAMSSDDPSTVTFIWRKDNAELSSPNIEVKFRLFGDGKSTEIISLLHLTDIENKHAGKYQCVVSNSYGTTYSQKTTISVLVYPTFTKVPKNVTVRAGETVKWECAANGEPPPEIAWHKDGGNDFPAARERRYITNFIFSEFNCKLNITGYFSLICLFIPILNDHSLC